MIVDKRYDVLVVGARCAGAAAAMLMARHGLRVLAIDRGQAGTDTTSTHALMRGGVMQLARWGVLPQIIAAGTPPVHETVFHYGEETVSLAVKPGPCVDALYAPRRTVLDTVLAGEARDAGVDLRYGHRLTDLVRRSDGRITGAVIVDPSGRPLLVRTRLVLGADGIGSSVARLSGAATLQEGSHASAVLYGHWSGVREEGYHWYYREGLSAGVIPTNDGRHCVFLAMRPEQFRTEMKQDPLAGYYRMLKEIAPTLAAQVRDARLENRLWAFAGRRSFMREAWGRGWALAGDAGYFKDPLTAHGITDALRDAELVSRATIQGSDVAFAEYAATREALSLPLFAASDAIASFNWDMPTLKTHHQALSCAMKAEVEHITMLAENQVYSSTSQEHAA